MVSTKNLKAGEIILKELPLIVGLETTSCLSCFGCYRSLSTNHFFCSKCLIAPVCHSECELKPFHAEFECQFYQKFLKKDEIRKDIIKNMQVTMPLKCLALKFDSDRKDAWENFMKLESHEKERKEQPVWKYYEDSIVNVSMILVF